MDISNEVARKVVARFGVSDSDELVRLYCPEQVAKV